MYFKSYPRSDSSSDLRYVEFQIRSCSELSITKDVGNESEEAEEQEREEEVEEQEREEEKKEEEEEEAEGRNEQGRIHGYPSRVRVGRSSAGEDH